MFNKMRGQKETLLQDGLDIRKKLHIKEKDGAGVSKEALVAVLKDIDGQDELKTLWGIDENQLLVKKATEHWIRKRKNAGMEMLKQLND